VGARRHAGRASPLPSNLSVANLEAASVSYSTTAKRPHSGHSADPLALL